MKNLLLLSIYVVSLYSECELKFQTILTFSLFRIFIKHQSILWFVNKTLTFVNIYIDLVAELIFHNLTLLFFSLYLSNIHLLC